MEYSGRENENREEPHLVPLSKQAIKILEELQKLTGTSQYAFPSGRTYDRPMSNNAILAALRRMGLRAMAKQLLMKSYKSDRFIEAQLAHARQ